MNRRTFVKLGAVGVAAAGLGSLGYAIGIEPHWLEIVERDLPIDDLPRQLEGARVAQLSDLHIGPRVSDAYVVGVFDRVRALEPDIVVVTGDFITYRAERGEAQSSSSFAPCSRICRAGDLRRSAFSETTTTVAAGPSQT